LLTGCRREHHQSTKSAPHNLSSNVPQGCGRVRFAFKRDEYCTTFPSFCQTALRIFTTPQGGFRRRQVRIIPHLFFLVKSLLRFFNQIFYLVAGRFFGNEAGYYHTSSALSNCFCNFFQGLYLLLPPAVASQQRGGILPHLIRSVKSSWQFLIYSHRQFPAILLLSVLLFFATTAAIISQFAPSCQPLFCRNSYNFQAFKVCESSATITWLSPH